VETAATDSLLGAPAQADKSIEAIKIVEATTASTQTLLFDNRFSFLIHPPFYENF
jgi:hypothetical protein